MKDRELLELAAKAAGLGFTVPVFGVPPFMGLRLIGGALWNPLTDDGDALRLAVKCGISVLQFPACIGTGWPQNGLPARLIGFDPPYEDISSGQDVLAATRRAIVRAAAEIGRSKT
jgi:hypothetical protein